MDFAKTIINAIKIWVNNKISIIEDKIFVLENKSPTFIQAEEPPEVPEGSLWVDLDEESSDIIEIEIDSELSETSENPVQNKVINAAINNLNTLIGDTAVAEQIENAIANIPEAPVTSVNGQTGDIVIDIPSIEGLATETYVNNAIDNIEMPEVPVTSVNGMTGDVVLNEFETKTDASAKLAEAKQYTDSAVANLVNSAPETLDTIGELAAAFEENEDMVAALDAVITNKADKSELFSGSWNDLTDKPFGETVSFGELYRNENLAFEKNEDKDNQYLSEYIQEALVLEDGKTYRIEWDGTEYTCVCWAAPFEETSPYIITYLGNMSIGNPDKENTGEPFMAQCMGHAEQSGVGVIVFGTTSTLDTHSVVINGEGFTAKTLDEKYIPDTIARVSDISSGFTGSWNDLTDRPFYQELKLTEIYSAEDIEFTSMSGMYAAQAQGDLYNKLEIGQTYTVSWDGVDYECIAFNPFAGAIEAVYIGNIGIVGLGDDTGEPFIIGTQSSDIALMTKDESSTHTIKINGVDSSYYFEEKLAKSISSDWEESDVNSIKYINNKPFDKTIKRDVGLIGSEQRTYKKTGYTTASGEVIYRAWTALLAEPIVGEEYRIGAGSIDLDYCICKTNFDFKYLGNLSLYDDSYEDTLEQFCFVFYENDNTGSVNESTAVIYTLRPVDTALSFAYGNAYEYKKIDCRYISEDFPRALASTTGLDKGQVLMGRPGGWKLTTLPCWLEEGTTIVEEFTTECNIPSSCDYDYFFAEDVAQLEDYTDLYHSYDYTVRFNNKSYYVKCLVADWTLGSNFNGTSYFLGNLDLFNFGGRYGGGSEGSVWAKYDPMPNNRYPDLPFLIHISVGNIVEGPTGAIYVAGTEPKTVTVGIYAGTHEYHQLDERFIPDTIARVTDIPTFPEMPEINYPVTSVNGQTGDVVIDIPTTEGLATEEYVNSAITNINTYYTKAEIDNMEFITLDEIDAICARTIEVVTPTTGTF